MAACSLWWPLEVFLALEPFAQLVTPTFVGMAMDTDVREVYEFLSSAGWAVLFPIMTLISAVIV